MVDINKEIESKLLQINNAIDNEILNVKKLDNIVKVYKLKVDKYVDVISENIIKMRGGALIEATLEEINQKRDEENKQFEEIKININKITEEFENKVKECDKSKLIRLLDDIFMDFENIYEAIISSIEQIEIECKKDCDRESYKLVIESKIKALKNKLKTYTIVIPLINYLIDEKDKVNELKRTVINLDKKTKNIDINNIRKELKELIEQLNIIIVKYKEVKK